MPDAAHSVAVVDATGDLDLATSRGLAARLGELAGSPGNAVLDLSQVGFMDSVGLAVVLKAVNRFRRQDKQLVLAVPPDHNVRRLLELTGTDGRVAVEPTREDALARATTQR
jgi:stage II sporulation protein AA (anti-sigma F factor antagonist)